ncbi:hypothetical protein GAMM_130010 [Gammaproteobacteria bacterium]
MLFWAITNQKTQRIMKARKMNYKNGQAKSDNDAGKAGNGAAKRSRGY